MSRLLSALEGDADDYSDDDDYNSDDVDNYESDHDEAPAKTLEEYQREQVPRPTPHQNNQDWLEFF